MGRCQWALVLVLLAVIRVEAGACTGLGTSQNTNPTDGPFTATNPSANSCDSFVRITPAAVNGTTASGVIVYVNDPAFSGSTLTFNDFGGTTTYLTLGAPLGRDIYQYLSLIDFRISLHGAVKGSTFPTFYYFATYTTAVSAISPNYIPVVAGLNITVSFRIPIPVWIRSQMWISFMATTGTCATGAKSFLRPTASAGTSTPTMYATLQSGLTAGSFAMCVSFDGGLDWVTQSAAIRMTTFAVAATTLDAGRALGAIPSGTSRTVTFTGTLPPSAQMVWAPSGMCGVTGARMPTALFNVVSNTVTSTFTITSFLTALGQSSWTVYPCLRSYTASLVQQTNPNNALVIAVATPLSLTSLAPSTFVVASTLVTTMTGLVATNKTRVGLSIDACATIYPGCELNYTIQTPTVTFNSACQFFAQTALSVCYRVEAGYVLQKLISATVTIDPLARSVTSVSPTIVGVGTTPSLTVLGITPNNTAFIGFANPAVGCGTCTTTCEGVTKISNATVTMTALTSELSLWVVCYSPNNKVSWSAQGAADVALQTIQAHGTSITNIDPVEATQGSNVTITFESIVGSINTMVSLTTSGCGTNVAPRAVPFGATSATFYLDPVVFPNAFAYSICYSTNNGGTWTKQSASGTFYVWAATNTSVLNLTPCYFGAGLILNLTMTGDPVFPNTWVSFATNCATGPYYGQTPYDCESEMSAAVPTAGTYSVCYSVRGGTAGSWVRQTALSVTVLVPSATEVMGVLPPQIGRGVVQTLNLTLTSALAPPPFASIAAVAQGGDCSQVSQRVSETDFTSGIVDFDATALSAGTYMFCLTYNGVDWVAQTATTLLVIAATPTSVSYWYPILYENGAASYLTLIAPITPTNFFSIALPGGCNITRYVETPFSNGTYQMSGILNTGLPQTNISICFSVDNGATWVEQTLVRAKVITACSALATCEQCHQNEYCSWCLTENVCGVQVDPLCPTIVTPGDTQGCPVIAFNSTLSGANVGNSNVTILSPNERFMDGIGLTCLWDFTISTTTTPLMVMSPGVAWCISPPTVGLVAGAYLTVALDGVQYTTTGMGQRGLWFYYDCSLRDEDVGQCARCWSTAKPECGMCLESLTCQPDFQCAGTWAGTTCPSINEVSPAQVNFRGDTPISLLGSLFIHANASGDQLVCNFGGNSQANASYVSSGEVSCQAPAGTANTLVQVSLTYGGYPFSSNSVPLLYLPDPAAIIDPATAEAAKLVGPLVGVITALLVIAIAILIIVYIRRRNFRRAHMPPTLTPALAEQIAYGEVKQKIPGKDMYTLLVPLMKLICAPGSPLPYAISKIADPTESDGLSRAMVVICEGEKATMDIMKALITDEVQNTEFMATLFRTNSFVMKMFKTYSKIAGLYWLHDSLGYELNASLASSTRDDGRDLDVKDETSDEVNLNKLLILTVCQRVFLAILKNEGRVPTSFLALFGHARSCVLERFPLGAASEVTRQAVGSLLANMAESQMMAVNYSRPSKLQERLLATGGGDLGALKDQLLQASAGVEALVLKLRETEQAIKDVTAGCDPDSEAARKLVASQEQNLNAIVVGGFLFLRFIVPAITAPHAFALMREPPDDATMRTLVLCGKVLQSLSNDKDMGNKEAFMAKMNEFILSNRKTMHEFQTRMAHRPSLSPPQSTSIPPPKQHLEASAYQLYTFIISKLELMTLFLETQTGGQECIDELLRISEAIQAAAGQHAAESRSPDQTPKALSERRRAASSRGLSLGGSELGSVSGAGAFNSFVSAGSSKLGSAGAVSGVASGRATTRGTVDSVQMDTMNPAFPSGK